MSKHQLGLRIDRVLYKQFQQVLTQEKLRPSEAIEALVKLAVQAGGVSSLYADHAKRESSGSIIDDALFKSRLARLKTCLDLEERHLKETGEELEDKESDTLVDKLTELGRRNISPELVKEFETCLSNADRLYEETQKSFVEQQIDSTKSRTAMRELIGNSPVSE
jgi:hypothetical protein